MNQSKKPRKEKEVKTNVTVPLGSIIKSIAKKPPLSKGKVKK